MQLQTKLSSNSGVKVTLCFPLAIPSDIALNDVSEVVRDEAEEALEFLRRLRAYRYVHPVRCSRLSVSLHHVGPCTVYRVCGLPETQTAYFANVVALHDVVSQTLDLEGKLGQGRGQGKVGSLHFVIRYVSDELLN